MADKTDQDGESKKNLVPGPACPPGPVAPSSRAPLILQPGSGLNTEARVAFISRIVESIIESETHRREQRAGPTNWLKWSSAIDGSCGRSVSDVIQ